MKVQIRYFAAVREALGAGETIAVAHGITVGGVRDLLIARDAAHRDALHRGRAVRSALNRALCGEASVVEEGAEIGFFPPVTGG